MGENAELWTRVDEKSQRCGLMNWLDAHHIKYDKNLSTEELAELYRAIECGKI